jgi:hypothetical protein
MRLMRTAAALICLLLVTACTSETTDASASASETADGIQLVEPDFRTVLQVDLRPGTSREDSFALLQKYKRSDGVEEARGGDSPTLFIFSVDAKADEIRKIRNALSEESTVEQVNVQHRK